MATQKPISTISYNSEVFLREKLENWVSCHLIQAYQYIWHKGEDGDKDHIHLRVEPNRKLDPMDLTDALKEYTSSNDKPLGCRPWRPSSEEDWIEYVVHDPDYLKVKGEDQGEKIPYQWQDVRCSPGYDVQTMYIRARQKLAHTSQSLAGRLRNGEDATTLVLEGENVFTVNALLHALGANDYTRVVNQLSDVENEKRNLQRYLDELIDDLDRIGVEIEDDECGHPRCRIVRPEQTLLEDTLCGGFFEIG